MKHESTSPEFSRRNFITGIGALSATTIIGSRLLPETPIRNDRVKLAIGGDELPPLAPPTPERIDTKAELERAWAEIIAQRSGRIDVALFDLATRQISNFTRAEPNKFKTASIIKPAILEKLLMDQPEWARENIDYIRPMITVSDNVIAQNLWSRVGGSNAMQDFFNQIGAPGTVAGPGGNLFSTATTAADQRWGVTGGVPADVTVEVKNGWVDERRNSIGHIVGQGVDYTMAVLTDDGSSAGHAVDTIELLSDATWQIMRRSV